MSVEYKAYEAKITPTKEEGVIEALVSVYGNVDRAKEIVMPGAFTKSIEKRLPYFVFGHQWDKIVGKTLSMRETSEGLVAKGLCNLETQLGRETYSNCKLDALNQFSIGYKVVKEKLNEEKDIRELHEVELYEWSPVLVGMNPDTRLISVKSDVRATFAQQADDALACFESLTLRTKELANLRAKEGRVISEVNRGRIRACLESMRTVADELDGLLSMSEPVAKASAEAIQEELAKLRHLLASQELKRWN